MRIGLDAMGGDHAPKQIVAGALKSLQFLDDDDTLVLFGDQQAVTECLGEADLWTGKIEVVHAPEVVAMDDPPVETLRKKRKSSIAVMAKAAADGQLDAVISAGNTGAYVAACQMRMRTIPGVLRPGIAVTLPTLSGPVVLCDVGANIAPKAAHLHQYALMASVYAHDVLGVEKPRVGLISIGQEDAKGNELVKSVNQSLREETRVNFVGNIEPRELMERPAEVFVCDGFVGNVILKLAEGLAKSLLSSFIREISQLDLPSEVSAKVAPAVKDFLAKHDYSEYGGAPLLGVDGICIICHGSSDARAICSTVKSVRQQVKSNINEKIAAMLDE